MAFPDIDPVLFSIGIFQVRWYALAYLAGIVLGWLLLKRLTVPRAGPKAGPGGGARDSVADVVGHAPLHTLINASIIGIILGGRLAYVLFYQPFYYLENPQKIIAVWEGGLAFHGGMLGMACAIIWTARQHRVSMFALGDLVAIAAPIGIFFGRLANFINAELYGRPTDMPWGVIFPNTSGAPRHPSQLYEALLEGFVLFCLLLLAWRLGARRREGLLICLFIGGYGLARIVVENFREPDPQLGFLFGSVTMGQILSAPMLVIGVGVGAWIMVKKARK